MASISVDLRTVTRVGGSQSVCFGGDLPSIMRSSMAAAA